MEGAVDGPTDVSVEQEGLGVVFLRLGLGDRERAQLAVGVVLEFNLEVGVARAVNPLVKEAH